MECGVFARMIALHVHQGRLAEFLPTTLEVFAGDPWNITLQAFVADCHARLGDPDEARRLYDPLLADDCALVPRDSGVQDNLTTLTETGVLLVDVPGASTLLGLLSPFGGQVLVFAGSISDQGAADRYIGMLETLTGDLDSADDHFRRAVALEERIAAFRSSPALASGRPGCSWFDTAAGITWRRARFSRRASRRLGAWAWPTSSAVLVISWRH